MRIVVAAESIQEKSGLGHFLSSGLEWLSKTNPSWNFDVIVQEKTAQLCRSSVEANVRFFIHGKTNSTRWQQYNFKGKDRLINFIRKFAPIPKIRAKFGSLRDIWKCLPHYDVVWVPHFDITNNSWPILYEKNFVQTPILFTIHDLHPLRFPDDWPKSMLENFNNGFVSFAKRSNLIITHSNYQKLDITKLLDIDSDKIKVTSLPFLLQENAFNKIDLIIEGQSRILQDEFDIKGSYFLFPATSTGFSHKNHYRLLVAWYEIKKILKSDCPLLVLTTAFNSNKFGMLMKTLLLYDVVRFVGPVSIENLALLYQNCSGVIVPSLYEGGGSGPVTEGFISKRPVLCSDIPPIREQIEYLGNPVVSFFDPTNIESIAQSVVDVCKNQSEFEKVALENYKRIESIQKTGWEEWANFYSREFTNLSKST